MDLAAAEVEIDVVERQRVAVKRLVEPGHGQERRIALERSDRTGDACSHPRVASRLSPAGRRTDPAVRPELGRGRDPDGVYFRPQIAR